MRWMWTRAVLVGALGLAASSMTVGCATERPPINRVQADALAKSFFVGENLTDITDDPEFFMRGTVVDVGFGAAQDGLFTSTYAQPVSRIKWEISEDYLNARLAYERIPGSDGKGNEFDGLKKKATNDGQIVASYRISSHFDIRRDYNPTTGEESNVIVENSTDRPWYQRQYFRVDWSQNLASDAYDFDTLSQIGLYGSVNYEPLAYTVLDPHDPDAPHFDAEQGYFDITNKAYATPAMLDLSSLGWGIDKFPACMLPGEFAGGTQPYGNCNPVEITIRESFKKAVDHDYEPVDYDGVRFEAFGIFNFNYRTGYERNYGMVDNKWFRFAARYNLWERSHFYADAAHMKGEIKCATKETTELPTGDPLADPNRDAKPANGTADECEAAGAGSRCDVFNGKCTLPYRQRKAVTIPWYIGGDTNEDLFEATDWAVQEWDLAMKTAIQTSRLVECRRTGGANCEATYPMWTGQQDDNEEAVAITRDMTACFRNSGWSSQTCEAAAKAAADKLGKDRGVAADDPSIVGIGAVVTMDPVIVLCHNPVTAKDHPACGPQGLSPRLGDLRYNSVLVIEKPQQPSAWGIMVDADDPVTGEKVAASINIWSHVTDLATQGLVDLVRYINGEISTADITDGKNVRDWATANKVANGGSGPTMTKAEIDSRLAASTKLDGKTFAEVTKGGLAPAIQADLRGAREQAYDAAVRGDIASVGAVETAARMNAARGTTTEAKLINQPMIQIAGIPGNVPVQGPVLDAASPLALNNPKLLYQLRQMRENALAKRGACIMDEAAAPETSSLTGIADIMKVKFPVVLDGTDDKGNAIEKPETKYTRVQGMFKYIQRRYHYAVLAHEMGHSVGLRHNFVSSYAALHYRPQYWQLRTKNGKVTTECTDAVADGASCVGPRYFDPITDEEQSQLIWMFMQSDVMDYPGDVSQDTLGLGAFNFAAARMFYGDTVSVYADAAKYGAGTAVGVGLTNTTDNFGGLVGIKYAVKGTQQPTNIHYSQLQKNYQVIDPKSCHEVTPQAPATWNKALDGEWHPLLDGRIVQVDGKFTKCSQMKVDYMAYDQLRMPTPAEIGGGFYRGGPSVDDQTKRVRVPYSFASDNWADTGNVSVFRHDNGADPYEQAMFLITTQENRHILDNFRRSRTTFNVRSAADRSFSRYNEKLLGISGGIGFLSNIYKNFATSQGYTYDTLWPFIVDEEFRENMIGATVAFDHFTRELSRPEPGEHYKLAPAYGDASLRSASDSDGNPGNTVVVIPNGSTGYLRDVGFGGHQIENALDDSKGDYAVEYGLTAGSYYDKINSAILLSESEDRFISQSRGDFYDARFRATGMADVLPEGWRRVMANSLTGDRTLLAPHVAANASGLPILDTTANDPSDPNAKKYPATPIGWTSWWPTTGPAICFPSDGRNVCQDYAGTGTFNPQLPANMLPVDPQIGWEVQKFLIAWTLAYIPANQHTNWLDMLRIFREGQNTDPTMEERIEWQDPVSGQVYYARTYGSECLFGDATAKDAAACSAAGGKWVQKGIAARVLEYANELTSKGYLLDKSGGNPTGYNKYGRAIVKRQPDGTPIVVGDAALKTIQPNGGLGGAPVTCDNNVDPTCTPLTMFDNHWAVQLDGYKSVPDYLWEVMVRFHLGTPDQLGVYPD